MEEIQISTHSSSKESDFLFTFYNLVKGETAPFKAPFSLSFLNSWKPVMFPDSLFKSRISGYIMLGKQLYFPLNEISSR